MISLPQSTRWSRLLCMTWILAVAVIVAVAAGGLAGCLTPAARAQDPDEGSEGCDIIVEQAFEYLVSDQYREALQMVQEAFSSPVATPECQAKALQTRSCTYLRMGERSRAITALTELLSRNPHAPYDGRMFPPNMNRLYRAVRDSFLAAGTMDIGTIAVLDFNVFSLQSKSQYDYDISALGSALHMIIGTDLVESTNLTVVDRTNMQDVLAELELSSNRELVNKENSIRLGELLNAHAFITGQMLIMDKKTCRIDLQIIHAATSRVFARQYTGPFSGEPVDLLDLQSGVLSLIVDGLNEFRAEVQNVGPIRPDPVYFDKLKKTARDNKRYLDTWFLQGEALQHEDAGRLDKAHRTYEEILKIDPQHKLARAKVWALKSH
jgi:tetratricopeptide (TPR) repeat protein